MFTTFYPNVHLFRRIAIGWFPFCSEEASYLILIGAKRTFKRFLSKMSRQLALHSSEAVFVSMLESQTWSFEPSLLFTPLQQNPTLLAPVLRHSEKKLTDFGRESAKCWMKNVERWPAWESISLIVSGGVSHKWLKFHFRSKSVKLISLSHGL